MRPQALERKLFLKGKVKLYFTLAVTGGLQPPPHLLPALMELGLFLPWAHLLHLSLPAAALYFPKSWTQSSKLTRGQELRARCTLSCRNKSRGVSAACSSVWSLGSVTQHHWEPGTNYYQLACGAQAAITIPTTVIRAALLTTWIIRVYYLQQERRHVQLKSDNGHLCFD